MSIDWTQVITAEDKAAQERRKKAEQRRDALQTYLDETDWMIVRHAETGEAVPGEVLKDRQAARDEISELRAML